MDNNIIKYSRKELYQYIDSDNTNNNNNNIINNLVIYNTKYNLIKNVKEFFDSICIINNIKFIKKKNYENGNIHITIDEWYDNKKSNDFCNDIKNVYMNTQIILSEEYLEIEINSFDHEYSNLINDNYEYYNFILLNNDKNTKGTNTETIDNDNDNINLLVLHKLKKNIDELSKKIYQNTSKNIEIDRLIKANIENQKEIKKITDCIKFLKENNNNITNSKLEYFNHLNLINNKLDFFVNKLNIFEMNLYNRNNSKNQNKHITVHHT